MTLIRTPDQRLRVFISSTLGELAPERAAVREAVERLRLAPVMFELGARPHPPRELYRSYLAQSHVFIGIYWERYGWIAPGETVSGLEDEYRLAGDRPRLLYIKTPAPEREERLEHLILDFQSDDRASYKQFETAEELAALVAEDLAVLLSERFEAAAGPAQQRPAPHSAPPLPLTETFGRADEIELVVEALRSGDRLVTVTGMGGIGKTRVALEIARAAAGMYPGGAKFVPLAAVTDPALVLRTIADRLGVRTEGGLELDEAIAEHLGGARTLLILDNLEQVVAAGPDIGRLVAQAPGLQVLATSRQALRVRGEREIPLQALPLPDPGAGRDLLEQEPAVRLFVERAQAVSPRFALTDENAPAVAELCRRLDGLPLAIELVAARAKLLQPAALLGRLGDRLDEIVGAGPDLPERHRTLRATIDWSYELLEERERRMFARLSVFAGGCPLSAAEEVCGWDDEGALDTIASLLDKSLVVVTEDPIDDEPRLRLLETVRSYAWDRLAESGDRDAIRDRHLGWVRRFSDVAAPFLCGPGQREWAARIDPERANVRAAVTRALELRDDEMVVELAWDLMVYYMIRDAIEEPESWYRAVLEAGRPVDEVPNAKLKTLWALMLNFRGDFRETKALLESSLAVFRSRGMDFEVAVAVKEVAIAHFGLDDDVEGAVAALEESSRVFEGIGHQWGVALVETMMGTMLTSNGRLEEAERHHQRSLEFSRRIACEPLMAQALHQLGLRRVLSGELHQAAPYLEEAEAILRSGGFRTEATYCLDAVGALRLREGEARAAARAFSVAAATRQRLGTVVWPSARALVGRFIDGAREALGPEEFGQAWDEARGEDVFEALRATLRPVTASAA